MRYIYLVLFSLAGVGFAPAQIRSAVEVRSLSYEQAQSGKAVELNGIVTYADPPSTVFIQDGTAGTFFRLDGSPPPKPGERVSVKGKSFSGLYVPGIERAKFTVLDRPGLPEPTNATFADLESGRFHYQWVSIEGIVRSVAPTNESAGIARLSVSSSILEVRVDSPAAEAKVPVGSRVRVTGLAAGEINNRRQLVKPYLRCTAWSNFAILAPPLPGENIPSVTPEELLTFKVGERDDLQVKIHGIVLAQTSRKTDNSTVFLREGEFAVGVDLLTSETQEVKTGDRLEVIGFPEMDRYSARLTDARIISFEENVVEEPEVFRLSWQDLISGDWDGNLVSVRGKLTHFYQTESDTRFVVRSLTDSRSTVTVSVPGLMNSLSPGMEIETSGICLVESTRHSGYRSIVESVSLLARSRDDIKILSAPEWWTAQRLTRAMTILIFVILLGGLWIFLLRRQVDRQTSALRNRIEHEAALEERQRIAREFHDTLEQDLTGLSLRLDAATAQIKEGRVGKLISDSRNLVSRIQTETRNLVSELRESPTKLASLSKAITELVTDVSSEETGPRIVWKPDGDIPMLPSRTVHHLKMIVKEAVTNAIKHSAAETVYIYTSIENRALLMKVADDGHGFDVEQETRGKSGHFGCMGMRERARKINADLEWKSSPDGSSVSVTMGL
ncbi:MAG: sensor histidine kinase [Verrucomicrobiales bacterium]|nr:sensor histidine kinase [Verrucomicrobiales bacterium]